MLHEFVELTEKSANNNDEDGQNRHVAYAICVFHFLLTFLKIIYLFICQRERERERERAHTHKQAEW